jgi:endoglucanase
MVPLFLAPLLSAGSPLGSIQVSGNRLVDEHGATVAIRGVNRMGTEYMCIGGYGIFDGPTDDNAINSITRWGVNAIRVPLNEDCWLNINGVLPQYGGGAYISAISEYVNRITNKGLYVIVDLHWAAPGGQKSTKQLEMVDLDHGLDFWKSVATTFASNRRVIYDLYNEPFNINWDCWKNGCNSPGYQTLGMQQLVTHIRGFANNTLMLGGLTWSNDLSQFLTYVPTDPINNLAASWHSYNFNGCKDQGCWNSQIAPVAAKYPVITGEFGENDCAHGYIDQLLPWMDSANVSYVAWVWNTADCAATPALITNYDGTPSGFGVGYKNHLAKFL